MHLAHAATAESDGGIVATGGRVLNVVAVGTTFVEARERVYRALGELPPRGRPAPHRHRRPGRRRALTRSAQPRPRSDGRPWIKGARGRPERS